MFDDHLQRSVQSMAVGEHRDSVVRFAARCRALVDRCEASGARNLAAEVETLFASIPEIDANPIQSTIRGMALLTLGQLLTFAGRQLLKPHRHERRGRHPKVDAALRFLESHYANPRLRLSDAAAHSRSSPSHLDRLLKRDTGQTFVQHVRRVRLRHATIMLRTSLLSVKEIGVACGYNSTSSFDRDCRRVNRCTPTELRRGEVAAAV